MLAWAAALLGLGSALGALLRSQSELNVAYDIGGVVLASLGGALVPLATLPGWARHVAPVSPGYWAMSALRSALTGQLATTFRSAAILATIAIATATLATRRINRGWSRSRTL